jgi:hypothetical protein
MKRPDLAAALEASRRAVLPAPSANLNQNVWREIRRRETTSTPWMNLDGFLNWFRAGGTSLAGATLALAILISSGLSLANGQPSHQQQVRQALGMNVFSLKAYPLTRLAENP